MFQAIACNLVLRLDDESLTWRIHACAMVSNEPASLPSTVSVPTAATRISPVKVFHRCTREKVIASGSPPVGQRPSPPNCSALKKPTTEKYGIMLAVPAGMHPSVCISEGPGCQHSDRWSRRLTGSVGCRTMVTSLPGALSLQPALTELGVNERLQGATVRDNQAIAVEQAYQLPGEK